MSQKLQVTTKGLLGQYVPGHKYKLIFGENIPFLFYCLQVGKQVDWVDGKPIYEYQGIGEFDDRILTVMAEATLEKRFVKSREGSPGFDSVDD